MRKRGIAVLFAALFLGLFTPACVLADETAFPVYEKLMQAETEDTAVCRENVCAENSVTADRITVIETIENIGEAADGESEASFAVENYPVKEGEGFLGSQWVTDEKGTRYMNDHGEFLSGIWVIYKGDYYYLGEDSYLVKSSLIYDGNSIYYADSEGKRYTAGFLMIPADDYDRTVLQVDHRWYYFGTDGKALRSTVRRIAGAYYAFDEDGKRLFGFADGDNCMLTGSFPAPGAVYYYGTIDDGMRYTGFLDAETSRGIQRFYFRSDGRKAADMDLTLDGKKYAFDEDGCMLTGWAHDPVRDIYRYYSTEEADKGAMKIGTWFETVPHETMSYEDFEQGRKRWFYFNASGSPVCDYFKLKEDGQIREYLFTEKGILCTGLMRVYEEHEQICFYEENLEGYTSSRIQSINDSQIIYAPPRTDASDPSGGQILKRGKVRVELSDGTYSLYFDNGRAKNGKYDDGTYRNGFRTDPHAELNVEDLTNNQSIVVQYDVLPEGAVGNTENYALYAFSGKAPYVTSASLVQSPESGLVRINFSEPLKAGSYTLYFNNGSLGANTDFVMELHTSVYQIEEKDSLIVQLSAPVVGCTDPDSYRIYPVGLPESSIRVLSAESAYAQTGAADTFRLILSEQLLSGQTYVIETRNMFRWEGNVEGGKIGSPCQGTIAYFTHVFAPKLSVYALTNNQSILFIYDAAFPGMYEQASYTVTRTSPKQGGVPVIASVGDAREETGQEHTVKINFTEPLDIGIYRIQTPLSSCQFEITLKLSFVRTAGDDALIVQLSSPIVGCTDPGNYKVRHIETGREIIPFSAVSAFEEAGHLKDSFKLIFDEALPPGIYQVETCHMFLWKDGKENTEPGKPCQGTMAYCNVEIMK